MAAQAAAKVENGEYLPLKKMEDGAVPSPT